MSTFSSNVGGIQSTASYKVELRDLQSILSARGLQARGPVQQFVGTELARRMDPRVPFRTGTLKNTVQVLNGGEEIKYPQIYAKAQYYRPRKSGGDNQRGPHWFQRTLNAEGAQIFAAAARMAGGKYVK